jgi:hypothetical protein
MTFSKITLSVVLVFVLATLVNCGKRDDHFTDPNTEATFFVDKGGITLFNTNVLVSRDAQQKPNQKDFKVQACMKDKAMQIVVQEQPFKVIAGENEMVKTTDVSGCIIWDEQIRYDALANEAELLVVRKIQAIRGHSGTISIELAINPWASEDGIKITDLRYDAALKTKSTSDAVTYSMVQFQADGNTMTPTFAMEVNSRRVAEAIASQRNKGAAPVVETRMRLDAINLQFLGHDYSAYEITSTLNLKVAHKYRIRISPQFIRENFNGKQIFETIASGNVKFHVAILKDTINPKAGVQYMLDEVLATGEFVGEMVDGVMVADVTLKFQDLAPLTGRTVMVLSSSSLPGYIQFRDGNYMSPVGPLVSATSISFIPTQWSAETIHQNHMAYVQKIENRSKSISNLDFFKRTTGFMEIPKSIETMAGPRATVSTNHYNELMLALDKTTKQDTNETLGDDEKYISAATRYAICSYLTQEKARGLRVCTPKNMELINFRKREIVDEITNPVPQRNGITYNEDLTINMNYLMSQDNTLGSGQSVRAGINAGLTAGLAAGLNLGLDLDLVGKLSEGKLPGHNWLSFISKWMSNMRPGDPVLSDPNDPNSPKIPGPPVPIQPKSGMGAKFGANLGANLGGMATYNNDLYTWTLLDAKRETGSISTSVKFTANAEMKEFLITGKFRKCWIMNLSTGFKEILEKQTGKLFEQLGLPRGLYACQSKVDQGQRREMYVLVNSITGIANSPLTDSLASSEAPLRLFFRGPIGYSVFKTLLTDKKMEVKFNKFPADKLIKDVQNLKNQGDMYLNQEFPGVLNPILK